MNINVPNKLGFLRSSDKTVVDIPFMVFHRWKNFITGNGDYSLTEFLVDFPRGSQFLTDLLQGWWNTADLGVPVSVGSRRYIFSENDFSLDRFIEICGNEFGEQSADELCDRIDSICWSAVDSEGDEDNPPGMYAAPSVDPETILTIFQVIDRVWDLLRKPNG